MRDHQGRPSGQDDVADVTVALPVYNGARYLEDAIRSALHQSVSPRDVLVFDNCSTDDTVEVAQRLLPSESVRVATANRGAIANFNRAVTESSGQYFMWLAADDRLLPRHLELCLRALVDHPEVAAALPGVRFIDPAGRLLREQTFHDLASTDARVRLRAFLRRGRWTEVYAVYRRSALTASPMFSNDFGSDVLLTWWFLLRGPLATVPEVLLEYREYPEKSVSEMAASLAPGAATVQWRKIRLWRRLAAATRAADLDESTRSIARRELRTALLHPSWLLHLYEDVVLALDAVAPPVAGLLRRGARLAGSRRRARASGA